jgi:ribosomal protein S27AE
MEFIKTKCRKCGYEIVIPEKTESVYCGSCGHINHYSKITSILKKYSDAGEIDKPGTYPAGLPDPSYKPVPGQRPESEQADLPADDEEAEFPEEKKASKILTAVFILAPFIAMAVEFFKLPSYVAVLIIIIIAVVVFTLKKK